MSALREKCEILVAMLRALAPVYEAARHIESQRRLIETTIGAAIFYLPQGQDLWTRHVSVAAVKLYHPDSGESKPRLTKEHLFPRQAVARALLQRDWDAEAAPADALLALYQRQYGRYTWVTQEENRRLVRFQRDLNLVEPFTAYVQAGVDLIEATHEQLSRVRARDGSLIEELLAADSTSRSSAHALRDRPGRLQIRQAAAPQGASAPAAAGKGHGRLEFRLDGRTFAGESVSDLYFAVLKYLVEGELLPAGAVPHATSSKRFLISRTPVHPTGTPFVNGVACRGFHMEAHKDRQAGLRHLGAFLGSIGRRVES